MKKMLRCTINGMNSTTQYGAIEALNRPQDYIDMMRSEYQRRRDIIHDRVKNSRYLEPFYPEGAFFLCAKIREFLEGTKDSWDFLKYPLERRVLVVCQGLYSDLIMIITLDLLSVLKRRI